jgi:hypothetical protein
LEYIAMTELSPRPLLSASEELRLAQPASHSCPSCGGPLTVGEDEAAGFCSACYWSTLET